MAQTVDYYKILQVSYGAPRDEITASYRRLCKLYHPDINSSPDAEEMMKSINLAYTALCEEKHPVPFVRKPTRTAWRGAHWHDDVKRARDCVEEYFSALMNGDYKSAYENLSDHDRRYVTYRSFLDWRQSVHRLFSIRSFSVAITSGVFTNRLKDGDEVPAVKLEITISERNNALQTVESYKISKLAIMEGSNWRVFLGYRDLSEIAKIFEDMSAEQEKGEMARHWEEYCKNTCRELNMLNRTGLLKKAEPELYRYKRYKQSLTIACFHVKPTVTNGRDEHGSEIIEAAAEALTELLRQTDVPAYLGSGVFAVLFVELKRKNAPVITQRITDELKARVHSSIGLSVYSECACAVYNGGELGGYLDRCAAALDS